MKKLRSAGKKLQKQCEIKDLAIRQYRRSLMPQSLTH